MSPDPIHDFLPYLLTPTWTTAVFWLLLIGDVLFAVRAWRRDPRQRNARMIAIAALRTALGTMWWQGSIWKVPPNYGGLTYWMTQMRDHAILPIHRMLVGEVVLPNIAIFGPLVYATEVAIAASLILGFASRAGALLGLAMTVNLWLGLYSAPGEWPWTYGFLILLQLLFIVDPPGRALGADATAPTRSRLLA
jgi:uncharacterized membrane protein YphA (DoxX/SURF4 family)